MTGRDLSAILGERAAGRLVGALGGSGRPGYVLRVDNKNDFARAEVEIGLADSERSSWSAFSSDLAKALGSPRGLAAPVPPRRLRMRVENGLIAWVRPVEEVATAPFGRTRLGDAELDAVLNGVNRLHAIDRVGAEPGRLGFYFKRPVPWPLFAVLEFARAFQPRAAQWARRAAAREVRAFGLGAGVMDVELV